VIDVVSWVGLVLNPSIASPLAFLFWHRLTRYRRLFKEDGAIESDMGELGLGGAGTAFGKEGVPMINRVSTTNNPTDKSLSFQSKDTLLYNVLSPDGEFMGQFAPPLSPPATGQGPLTATGHIIPSFPYPTYAVVYVYDATTLVSLGSQQVQLFGGDVFIVRITYHEYIPIASGYVSVQINGGTGSIIPGSSYQQMQKDNEDLIPRGSY
jgi:hypothetical protein